MKSITRTMGFLVYVLIFLICEGQGFCVAASGIVTAEKEVFTQTKTPVTKVSWRSRTLIEKDTINYLEPKTFANTGRVRTSTVAGWQVVNTVSEDSNLPYRKEVGIRSDRVELTMQMELPSYQNDPAKPVITYSFFVPCKLLEGMKWKAMVGQSYAVSTVKGELTDKTPDGNLVGSATRWIAFEGNGKNIVFDLNPAGLSAYKPGANGLAVMWDIQKVGRYLCFNLWSIARFWGGVSTGKVIIFEGTGNDYLKHHTGNLYSYFWVLPVKYNFTFGTKPSNNDFISAGGQLYDNAKGYGWETNDGLVKIGEKTGSLVYNGLASSKDNTFMCRVNQPGLYIVRILASNCTLRDVGPFSVTSNGETKAVNVVVHGGRLKDITFSEWLSPGVFRLKFSGSWIVSSISLQMLLHREEDFSFHRGMWLVAGEYEPAPIMSSRCYSKPVSYKVAITEMDLPPQKVVEPKTAPTLPAKEVLLPDPKDPNLAWRYDGFIGGLGPDNNGTFLEFDTPEKIRQRLKEIKVQGVNVILLNGLLCRHCHEYQLPRVEKTVKEIVRIAHEEGIKVLDHVDLTLLENLETTMRTMVEHIDWCQRTIDGDTIIQGWCPINPDFQKKWFAWIKQYIAATEIDGIMVDEVAFHKTVCCGCSYCRAEFTKETGLVLPIGENVTSISNSSSLLYKTWLEWRKKVLGDWWIAFRKEVLADRPDFCIMGYMSESGVQSDYGSYNYGYDLFEMARANDFVGTEIMSRNVMDNYRYVFSSRRLYNVFRQEYGSPVFGLVYHNENEYFAYFGWAMNNMMAQATWDISPISVKRDTPNYLYWQENMDKRLVKPFADIAIVFSVKSRDRSSVGYPGPEALGISQILSDSHVPHLFLTDRSLEKIERIKNYRLVILPNAACLSDVEIQTIQDYVRGGGHVLLTGYTGLLDDYGTIRKRWGFAGMTGWDVSSENVYTASAKLMTPEGDLSASLPVSQKLLKIVSTAGSDVLLNAIDNKGKVLGPVCVSRWLGEGQIIYSTARLGEANYQRDFNNGEIWNYELNQPLAKVLLHVIRQTLEKDFSKFKAVQMPSSIICSLWVEENAGHNRMFIHLLNATGVQIRKGQVVLNDKALPTFPPLKDNLVFEIELPSFSKGYVTSPDYTGHKEVTVEKIGDNRYRLIVSKDALKAYAIIVLE